MESANCPNRTVTGVGATLTCLFNLSSPSWSIYVLGWNSDHDLHSIGLSRKQHCSQSLKHAFVLMLPTTCTLHPHNHVLSSLQCVGAARDLVTIVHDSVGAYQACAQPISPATCQSPLCRPMDYGHDAAALTTPYAHTATETAEVP